MRWGRWPTSNLRIINLTTQVAELSATIDPSSHFELARPDGGPLTVGPKETALIPIRFLPVAMGGSSTTAQLSYVVGGKSAVATIQIQGAGI